MPARSRVAALVARVEQGKFVDALQEFYAEDATMQENNAPPRVGLAALVAHERGVMASFGEVTAALVDTLFIEGDRVVIHWRFEFTGSGGKRIVLDELAYQLWRGDKVAVERFYYDPAQFRA